MVQSFRSLVACVAWPALLAGCVATTAIGFSTGWPVLGFNLTYLALAASLLLLERWMPHEAAWQPHDGQFRLDLGHTMVSNGTIQALLVLSGVIGLSALLARLGHSGLGLWPHQWPLAPQVALGLAVSEFAAYWAHRTAHEWEPLWYFHAIHHSVEKLWCVNSGRFHFVDALKSVVPGVLILVLAGAPAEVMAWLSALTGYIGIMTHTNVAMRFGPLNYVFNTPALHRWHHSMDLREGNKNYGENLVIWDLAFGTYFNAARRPPVTIGTVDPLPAGLVGQLLWPFRRSARALARGRLRDQQPTLGPAASGMPRSPSAVSH
jgi:sterol desaturase/sphingolipid hydroxylase (fatty acid hydroxylase superfamily)